MSLKARLLDDLKTALKAGDAQKVGVLRMVKAEILKKEVSLRAEKGRDYQLDDSETTQVLGSYAKQRRQSIEAFAGAGRDDLKAREEAELAILEDYLPRALEDEELEVIIDEALAETGTTGMAEMGAVMKAVMRRVAGRADGRKVSALVREKLQ